MTLYMTREEARKRVGKLKKEINRYRYAYHVLDKSLISDEVLDSLKKELFDLEQQFPELVTLDSPTQRIGGQPLKEFKKARHETPMLSFNDAFSEEDMGDWFKRLENYVGKKIQPHFYCELKIDGLAIELVYENSILVQGSTRGDGLVGEDITQNLKTVEAIPLKLESLNSYPLAGGQILNRLVIRGEVFLTKKEFERINRELIKKNKKPFANPRNLAAGAVRQLDPKVTASRKLDSFAYDVVTDLKFKNHSEEHEFLKKLGFKINHYNKKCGSLEEVFALQKYWNKNREKLAYEVDGIVVIVDSNRDFNEGGVIGKAPRAAIAYKFSPREATTVVEDIKVYVGRTGTLTPVAKLKPITVGGVTISNATLHNYDEIKRLGVKIGDTVIVSRAGDVIPQISKVLKNLRTGKEKEFHMPKYCPVDGSRVAKEGVYYRCSNRQCGAIQREFLYHFVSKKAFNIDGLGPQIIDKFLEEGLISDAADIFRLKKENIETLEGFGKKSAENIINEVSKKKEILLERFIYSLGILHVGEETAQLLAKHITAISKAKEKKIKAKGLLQVFKNFTVENLQSIHDIGPVVAQSIYNWFKGNYNRQLVEKLSEVGVEVLMPERKSFSEKLKGLSFVLTGSLESMARDDAKAKIREFGGGVSESVSKKTSYVVAGKEPGLKYDKAKKLGIKILDEKNFLALIK